MADRQVKQTKSHSVSTTKKKPTKFIIVHASDCKRNKNEKLRRSKRPFCTETERFSRTKMKFLRFDSLEFIFLVFLRSELNVALANANYSERWIHKQNRFQKMRARPLKWSPFVQIQCSISTGGHLLLTFDSFFYFFYFAMASRNKISRNRLSMKHSPINSSILTCLSLIIYINIPVWVLSRLLGRKNTTKKSDKDIVSPNRFCAIYPVFVPVDFPSENSYAKWPLFERYFEQIVPKHTELLTSVARHSGFWRTTKIGKFPHTNNISFAICTSEQQ